ncbi:hypothetical protein B0H13DRAFT_760189 [Mycena leptocephala]|nr:hypothetical protein B0H13DRAFT_760189 [Mycena leptocephala]
MVGPALPQALRAVRYPLYEPDGNFSETDKDDHDTMATCPEEHGPSVITSEDQRKLEENSKVGDTLEDIFSLTQKDRTSQKNTLTPEESWRFRRAVYRISLYTSIFPVDCYEIDEFDDDIDLIQHQRTAILHEYPTDDLFQLYGVARFFRGILEGVPVGDEEHNN